MVFAGSSPWRNERTSTTRRRTTCTRGYSRNLGVSCDYCHNTEDYGSDEKKEKETA
jgi:hypothetical protein